MKKYQVKKKLGKGAMGEVYLAHDTRLNREVAIKKLMFDGDAGEGGDDDALSPRFEQEAQAAARLNHPNIITIHDVAITGKGSYIVMELLRGKSLLGWIREGRVFSIPEAATIGARVCRGLDYAHKAGVIHRDVKPDNIFLDRDFGVKITDFGLARLDKGALVKTTVGSYMGTPAYSSPEQLREPHKVDGRSDIYSTGVLLYRLISGKLPFAASDMGELITRILIDAPTPLGEILPDLPETLEHVVMKAIQKDPDKRFETAGEMAEALEAVAGAEAPATFEPGVGSAAIETGASREGAAPAPVDDALSTTVVESTTLVLDNLAFDAPAWAISVFESWEKKELGKGLLNEILDRLLDIPIYTDPFSGALFVDERFLLLIWKGHILQAVDARKNRIGEKAMAAVPDAGRSFTIFSPPKPGSSNLPLVLSTALDERKAIHENIESAVINVAALIHKLIKDRFTGVVRLRYERGAIQLGFYAGSRIFMLRSPGLNLDISSTVFADVSTVLGQMPFTADVFETRLTPRGESLRRFFRDARILVERLPEATPNHLDMLKQKKKDYHPHAADELRRSLSLALSTGGKDGIRVGKRILSARDLLRNDFCLRFREWLLFDLFIHLLSSGARDSMKYVCTWIPGIETLHFNFPLEDEEGRKHYFDIVAMDRTGKILHLVQRGRDGGVDAVGAFLDSAISVKRRLTKTGDVGGVFHVSPETYTDESMTLFHERTAVKKKQMGLGLLDSLTGYKGFVRIGKNRGFHFNLVAETESGFRLVGPVL